MNKPTNRVKKTSPQSINTTQRPIRVVARVTRIMTIASAILAVGSLAAAFTHAVYNPDWFPNWLKYGIVFFWVLVPPVWLWCEWKWVCYQMSNDDREYLKHFHDLARNVWLALVLVLCVLFKIKLSVG